MIIDTCLSWGRVSQTLNEKAGGGSRDWEPQVLGPVRLTFTVTMKRHVIAQNRGFSVCKVE